MKKMSTVAEHFGVPALNAKTQFVGLECEIETIKRTKPEFPGAIFSITEDGSLRNTGREFISIPMKVDDAILNFERLHATIEYGKEAFSERTSIHVHVDCTSLTLQECRNVVLNYALFEEFFFLMVDPSRRHNIHCVPLTETYLPFHYKQSIPEMFGRWHKYTALNIKPLGKFGTIEFRHMQGHNDVKLLQEWLKTIENLVAAGKTFTPNRSLLTDVGKVNAFKEIFKDSPSVYNKVNLIPELTFNTSLDLKLAI